MSKRLKEYFAWFGKAIKFLIGSNDKNTSSERINSTTFLFAGFLISLLSCIFNFLEGFNFFLNLFTIFASAFLLVLYYFSRFKNKSNIWLSASCVMSLLSVSWFMNAGAIGSTSFMYLFTVIVLTITAEKHQQNGLFMLILLNIMVLYFAEYLYGNVLVRPYMSVSNQYSDIVFVFLLILIGVFYTTRFIKRSYDIEKKSVRERTKELELADEKRTNIFINLAHETKTPLTLISNYLDDYIKKNQKEDDTQLKILKNAVNRLTKDIVNFFDMEKIQKGLSMYDHNQICNFSGIIEDGIKLFNPLAARKQIQINSIISPNIFIKGDPNAIMRILGNLMENAIKYTSTNGIIRVELKEEEGKAYFIVNDNGMGIPLLLQEKIFEPYFQINSQKANFQGIGLGLSIVKGIVEELSGHIKLSSNPDERVGTEVSITLSLYKQTVVTPVKSISGPPLLIEEEMLTIEEQEFDENKFTIMIVEDNISLLNYTVAYLQKNYNVYFALSGKDAIQKLKEITELDLIISDIMMDDGDGFYFYQFIVSSKRFKHLPFIFLTAKHEIEARMKGLSMGAIDYIAKPFSIIELDEKLNSILKNFISQRNAILTNAYQTLTKRAHFNDLDKTDSVENRCDKYNLTPREVDVIKLVAKGKINKEIGTELNISVDTVKKHIQNIFEKTEVNNKIELLKKIIY